MSKLSAAYLTTRFNVAIVDERDGEHWMSPPQKQRDRVFSELVSKHQTRIFGFVYAMVQDRTDTEDLVQRTLLTLWRRFDEFEQDSDFCAWAITTARYEVLNFQRANRRRNQFTEALIGRLVDEAAAARERDSDDDRRDALESCVDDLSAEDRKMLDARYAEDQKLGEMAEHYDRSEQSVSNSLSRIRRFLFDCVRRRLAQEASS